MAKKIGRKLKLTPAMIKKIAAHVRIGNYAITACRACGIGETTYYRWLENGERENSGIYREFWEAIKTAEAEAELMHVSNISRAGIQEGNWIPSMTILERKYPDRWGRKDKTIHAGDRENPVEINNANLNYKKIEELSEVDKYNLLDIIKKISDDK